MEARAYHVRFYFIFIFRSHISFHSAQVEAGKLALEPAPFDLGQELESMVDMFAVQCAKKNVALVLDLDDRLPRRLTGDRARVRQILANLVGNSCKVSEEGRLLFLSLCQPVKGLEKLNMDHNNICFWDDFLGLPSLDIFFGSNRRLVEFANMCSVYQGSLVTGGHILCCCSILQSDRSWGTVSLSGRSCCSLRCFKFQANPHSSQFTISLLRHPQFTNSGQIIVRAWPVFAPAVPTDPADPSPPQLEKGYLRQLQSFIQRLSAGSPLGSRRTSGSSLRGGSVRGRAGSAEETSSGFVDLRLDRRHPRSFSEAERRLGQRGPEAEGWTHDPSKIRVAFEVEDSGAVSAFLRCGFSRLSSAS